MSFVLSKVFWWIASPGNLLLLLIGLGAILLLLDRRGGRLLVTVAALCMLVLTLTPVAELVLAPLENRFPAQAPPARVDGVIVLGGAINEDISIARGTLQVTASASRLIALADLARRYPMARLVYSGGTADLFGDQGREADIAGRIFDALGLGTGRLILENRSRNTYENALYSRDLVMPKPGEVWLLVTSAYHMPRAVGIFRRIGWEVRPYPVDYRTRPDRLDLPGGFLGGLDTLHWALREWIGLTFYYLAGRSSAWFPAPQTPSARG